MSMMCFLSMYVEMLRYDIRRDWAVLFILFVFRWYIMNIHQAAIVFGLHRVDLGRSHKQKQCLMVNLKEIQVKVSCEWRLFVIDIILLYFLIGVGRSQPMSPYLNIDPSYLNQVLL